MIIAQSREQIIISSEGVLNLKEGNKVIETKFFTFDQNNSGGYFVEDESLGICEYVIIEAINYDHAWSILESIGDNVDGFYDYCSCCGERWSYIKEEGYDEPMIYNNKVDDVEEGAYSKRCFVHYLDGRMRKVKFKKDEAIEYN